MESDSWEYSADGRVVRASASGAVDWGLIPSRSNDFEVGNHSFLLEAQH